ncbi:AAA family ATPase [Alphaproteobacteria bacterium GH1-50]|uniref:AAA family ATPase n=1 Tax=Kangsaoukella pontilimi TaxID=2691042 RepID=A0A7C9MIY2_9RHOB|nr:AAA family ATPase [Kangsaoukella pontilimi]MXQ07335.1 AAA family ATPase [Kangsaoukella pontilimi]
MADNLFVLTGCSGGGKSTLLHHLSERGFATVPEPGRRIVAEEVTGDGRALPWVNLEAFAHRAVAMARADLEDAKRHDGVVFFDRGLLDAAVALAHAGGPSVAETMGDERPYNDTVFVVPPWEELFSQDAERRHDFGAAVREHRRIEEALRHLAYKLIPVPKASVEDRASFLLAACGLI